MGWRRRGWRQGVSPQSTYTRKDCETVEICVPCIRCPASRYSTPHALGLASIDLARSCIGRVFTGALLKGEGLRYSPKSFLRSQHPGTYLVQVWVVPVTNIGYGVESFVVHLCAPFYLYSAEVQQTPIASRSHTSAHKKALESIYFVATTS